MIVANKNLMDDCIGGFVEELKYEGKIITYVCDPVSENVFGKAGNEDF
jgi:hypothetical protein